MNFQPSNFYISIIDLFAILLPGAIAALVIYLELREGIEVGIKGVESDSSFIKGFGLLAAAYLLGHFIGQLSAYLDEWIYDPLKKKVFSEQNRVVKVQCIRKKKYEIKPNPVYVNAYKWSLYKLQREMPEAAVEVNRYMADSKFFRSFFVLLLVLAIIKPKVIMGLHDALLENSYANEFPPQVGYLISIIGGIILLLYIFWKKKHDSKEEEFTERPCEYIDQLEKKQKEEKEKEEEQEKKNWRTYLKDWIKANALMLSICLIFIGLFLISEILLLLAGFSLVRYFKKRHKATDTAYQYIIFLETQNTPPKPKLKRKKKWLTVNNYKN